MSTVHRHPSTNIGRGRNLVKRKVSKSQMPRNPYETYSDMEVLALAIQRLGSQVSVAQYLNVHPSAISKYLSRKHLSKHIRPLLEILLSGKVEIPTMRSASEAYRMLEELYFLTRAKGRVWNEVIEHIEKTLRLFPNARAHSRFHTRGISSRF